MRYLLDKVTIRFILQALRKLGESQRPTDDELESLRFFSLSIERHDSLFISPASFSVLQHIGNTPRYTQLTQIALQRTEVAIPGRYYKRWSRRLRDVNFTREDAAILAFATFGTDSAHVRLGMDAVITFDQPMINNWDSQQSLIRSKLTAMREKLPLPYRHASLPRVIRPNTLLRP